MPNSGAGGFLGEGGALVASQLMADETERSSSDSSSEPRRPRMKRPNGDWRRLPRERDRWRRLPREDLGEALGTQACACPGAVVDMVEPMVGFGFLWFSFVLMSFRIRLLFRGARKNTFCGRALLVLRLTRAAGPPAALSCGFARSVVARRW